MFNAYLSQMTSYPSNGNVHYCELRIRIKTERARGRANILEAVAKRPKTLIINSDKNLRNS